ncbi:MAG: hypothetical protein KAU17_15630 [Spirochaetales bacterium]|nr:hypothetical protein [Spirochaetales bacterium]
MGCALEWIQRKPTSPRRLGLRPWGRALLSNTHLVYEKFRWPAPRSSGEMPEKKDPQGNRIYVIGRRAEGTERTVGRMPYCRSTHVLFSSEAGMPRSDLRVDCRET